LFKWSLRFWLVMRNVHRSNKVLQALLYHFDASI
jgi:hypothetical protein